MTISSPRCARWSRTIRIACCGAPTGRTPIWSIASPTTAAWSMSSRASPRPPNCSASCSSIIRCGSTGPIDRSLARLFALVVASACNGRYRDRVRIDMPIFLATGDIAPDREHPNECFAATRDVLQAADLVFGQLETSFAERGTRLPQARHAVLTKPEGAAAVGRAGFDIISMAGNHVLDWGNEAMFETIGHLNAAGVAVVGAGENIAAARGPAISVLDDGARVALLAYSSILPMTYWAEDRRPGCAPMRAHTIYEQIEQ